MTELLMCPPTHYQIEYEINPWMDVHRNVDQTLAERQWNELCEALCRCGATISVLEAIRGLPDMVFTGDGGLALHDHFLVSNFRPAERRPESAAFAKWARDRGLEVEKPPDDVIFEGLGDVVIHGNNLITAYGQRSSPESARWIAEVFPELDVIATLELSSPRFFHLGMSLALLDGATGLYFPEAFSPASNRVITELPYEMIAVEPEDAESFAVNAIVLDRQVIVHACSSSLKGTLTRRGFEVHECNVSEFVKSGGGTRCLVLPILS